MKAAKPEDVEEPVVSLQMKRLSLKNHLLKFMETSGELPLV